jgi:hypothetical protein
MGIVDRFPPGRPTPMFAIWRPDGSVKPSVGVSSPSGVFSEIQMPEKSGLPLGNRGAGAVMSTEPSASRGTLAVG